MDAQVFDTRFCQAALDGLKSYTRTEFTVRILRKLALPVDRTLGLMWTRIQEWIAEDPRRCRELWEHVDDLRLWGRQRIFLFEVDEDFAQELSDPAKVKEAVGGLYDEPLYKWDAQEPFLASVRYQEDLGLLIFKLIENRSFELVVEGQLRTFEDRATNFFVLNLRNRHAELRIQDLPKGAVRDAQEERNLLESVLRRYLDFTHLRPIELGPVMDVLLRVPVDTNVGTRFTITSTRVKFKEREVEPDALELVAFLNGLFRKPDPSELTAYWNCSQDVLGEGPLHFRLSGSTHYVGIDGIADPVRVRQLLEKIVDISRHPKEYLKGNENGPSGRGLADALLKGLEEEPVAQAIVLSAGAIAASVLWIVAEAVGDYFYEQALDWALRGLPVAVITVPLEVAWVFRYYGWRRVWRGFRALLSLSRADVQREFIQAWKRRKDSVG